MAFVEMPQTMWTQISRARRRAGDALEELLKKYRPPIVAFIRNMGADPEGAEDLAQEVFLRIVEEEVLEKADKGRGRFRSLLLSVVRHTAWTHLRDERRLKRGGGEKPLSLQAGEEMRLAEAVAAPEVRDEEFDPLWVKNLVGLAQEKLAEECRKKKTPPYHEALTLHIERGLSYPEIAKALGVSRTDVKNYLHQARERLRKLLLAEILSYSSSRAEYEAECAYLMRLAGL